MFEDLTKENKVGILMQAVPDPDAIGAAMAVKWLIHELHGIGSEIYHKNKVSHPQTRAMLNVLGIAMHRVEALPEDIDYWVIVDSGVDNTGFELKPNVIIDHHDGEYPNDVELIHNRVGSTCTILVQMLQEAGIELDDKDVGAALYLGLYTDTGGLTNSSTREEDFEAFRYLSTRIDSDKTKQVFDFPIPLHHLQLEAKGISALDTEGSHLVTCLGDVDPGHRDVMPTIADRLLRIAGINTVVVFSFIGDMVDASVRSSDSTLDVGAFCKDIFEVGLNGTAGSKQGGIGGGRAPLGIAVRAEDTPEERAKALGTIEETLRTRILRRLSK